MCSERMITAPPQRYNPFNMAEAAVKTPARRVRPKYLNLQALLFEIRLPLPGWISILHRISGALLFAALVWLLWMLDLSLSSEAAFEKIKHYAGLWRSEEHTSELQSRQYLV